MQAFGSDDLALATELYTKSNSANDRALLDWFIDHPGVLREGYQLAGDLGFAEVRLVARSTYNISLAAADLGRARPWTEGQMGYLMPSSVAELFVSARESVAL
ncbi:hypothetical protein BH09CHL1_BH09CHL1_23750 [soil metagenome]